MCSHPCTGDAKAEMAEKNHEKFSKLEFFATKSQTLSPSAATTARWRRNSFKKNRITI